MTKYYHVFVSFIIISFSNVTVAQDSVFTDNFDFYNTTLKLACQDSVNWTTWGGNPCSDEDAEVEDTYSSSPPNSIVITQGVDLVKPMENITDVFYTVKFEFYVPDGKTGYFNVLQLFDGNASEWGIEVFLNAGGVGAVNAGGNNTASFAYTYNQWHSVEININIAAANDVASLHINSTEVHTWAWSTGAIGTGGSKQIGGVNFYGATATDELYIDNFEIIDNTSIADVEDYTNVPAEFELVQNYPNPFNPSTKIVYSIPQAANVNLTIYNMLGEEIAVLVNGHREAGVYNYTFNADNLTSGTYIYKLIADGKTSAKKMLLIK